MSQQSTKVRKRDEQFANRTVTRIWDEEASVENPYLAQRCRCHGYDILELAEKRSFVEVLFLLFQGELPSSNQAKLLETLMIATMNPGPRHPGTRAAMNAGVGKTNTAHILPISLSIIGGSHLGGEEVVEAMHFLRKKRKYPPQDIAEDLQNGSRPPEGDWHIVAGFGSRFGGIDPMPQQAAACLLGLPGDWQTLQWGDDFSKALSVRPDYVDAYFGRANSRSRLKDYEGVVSDLSKVIELRHDSAVAHNNRGIARAILGNYREAVDDFSRAIQLKPNYKEAHDNLERARSHVTHNK